MPLSFLLMPLVVQKYQIAEVTDSPLRKFHEKLFVFSLKLRHFEVKIKIFTDWDKLLLSQFEKGTTWKGIGIWKSPKIVSHYKTI